MSNWIFITSVYRKPTFSAQYLNFNSINHINHKLTVIRTLFHRAKYYCIKDLLNIELNRIFSDLKLNGYPPGLIERIFNERFFTSTKLNPFSDKSSLKYISIPYYKGISESVANLLKSVNIFTAFKPKARIKKKFTNFKPRSFFL